MDREIWELEFAECEHGGDLASYTAKLAECGAEVLESRLLSTEEETGMVKVRVAKEAKPAFLDALRASEVVGFVQSMRPCRV